MRFIAANTSTPVPRVHETKFRGEKVSEMVMDYMPGEPLDKAWAKLTQEQRIATCRQLKGYLSQLSQLKGGPRIEPADGGSVTVGLRFPRQGGPFADEKEFNEFMVNWDNTRMATVFKQYAQAGLTDNHEIHFVHGDFSPRNILVDETGCVTAVLDWDRSGWYPEYWDVVRMLTENPGIHDYFPYINHIIPVSYVPEFLALKYVLRVSGDG